MLKVNRHTERGTETRRYLPERHEAAWNEREYAVGKIAELEAENAKLRELAERAWKAAERLCQAFDGPCRADDVTAHKPCPMGERDEECVYGQLQLELRELGVEVDG